MAEQENTLWPKPEIPKPNLEQLTEWSYDCVCETTDGCMVEPDGVCEHGHASWLIYLGWI